MDCPASAAAPLHRRGDVGPHPHLRRDVRVADERGHLPVHRHPGGGGGLDLPGPVRRGHGAPRRPHQRARLLHHRRRHRAHRVAVDPRHWPAEGLLPAGRRHRRAIAQISSVSQTASRIMPPGMHAAQRASVSTPPTCRWRSSPSAADAVRGAALRLRPQLHPRPPVHHPRLVHPRRPTAASSARSRSTSIRRQLGQGTVAPGRGQRAARLQRHRPGRHRPHRRHRIQRRAQLQPGDGGPVQRHSGQGGRWRPGPPRRRRHVSRRLTPTRPTSSTSTASAPPTSRILKHSRRLDARGRRRRARASPAHPGRGAPGAGAQDRLRPVGLRARRDARRASRGAHLLDPGVADDPLLPRQLAQRGHRLALRSRWRSSGRHHRALPHRPHASTS